MRTWRLTADAEAEAKGAGEDPRERAGQPDCAWTSRSSR